MNDNDDGAVAVVCNGKRDRTGFCSLKEFTDSRLASDYHFLEDVLKVSEGTRRLYQGIVASSSAPSTTPAAVSSRKRPRGGPEWMMGLDSISPDVPAHPLLRAKEGRSVAEVLVARAVGDDDRAQLDKPSRPGVGIVNQLLANGPANNTAMSSPRAKFDPLVRQAELKGITLLRMPSGMQRRRANTSRINKKMGTISWKIEFCFHRPKRTLDERMVHSSPSASAQDESTLPKLFRVESEILDSSTLSEELGRHLDVHPHNSATRSCLRSFVNTPRKSLVLLMKRLPCSSAAPRYFRLDPNATLSESLDGKTIIEFPTIDVVLDEDKEYFPLYIGEVN